MLQEIDAQDSTGWFVVGDRLGIGEEHGWRGPERQGRSKHGRNGLPGVT